MTPRVQHLALLLGGTCGLLALGQPLGVALAVAVGFWLLVVIA